MPHISSSQPPPRFVTLLVEGQALGAGVKQRVVVDRDAVLPHLERDAAEVSEAQRLRNAMNALLATLEAQLVPTTASGDSQGKRLSLPVDSTQLYIFSHEACDFVPLHSPADLLDMGRLRIVGSGQTYAPGSATGSRPSSRANRPQSAGSARSPTPPGRASSALGHSGSMRLAPRRSSTEQSARGTATPAQMISFAATIVRALATSPFQVSANTIRDAAGTWDPADPEFDVRDEDVAAGNLQAVADILVGALAAGHSANGGRPHNPLQQDLDDAQERNASLEAQIAEQQTVVEMLQNALLEMREVVERVAADGVSPNVAVTGKSPATATPSTQPPQTDTEASPIAAVAPARVSATRPKIPMDSAATAGLPPLKRFVVFYAGRTEGGATAGTAAVAAESAGKRSRMVPLAEMELPTIELVETQAALAFGRAAPPRGWSDDAPDLALRAGFTRRQDSGNGEALAFRFSCDAELVAYLQQQVADGVECPVVRVFPEYAMFEAHEGTNASPQAHRVDGGASFLGNTPGEDPRPRSGADDEDLPPLAGSDGSLRMQLDGSAAASPFVRPTSALGFGRSAYASPAVGGPSRQPDDASGAATPQTANDNGKFFLSHPTTPSGPGNRMGESLRGANPAAPVTARLYVPECRGLLALDAAKRGSSPFVRVVSPQVAMETTHCRTTANPTFDAADATCEITLPDPDARVEVWHHDSLFDELIGAAALGLSEDDLTKIKVSGRVTLELPLAPGPNPTREVSEHADNLGTVVIELTAAGERPAAPLHLRATAESCKDLLGLDATKKASNPFVRIVGAAGALLLETKAQARTTCPVFDDATCEVALPDAELRVEVWHHDVLFDELIGTADIAVGIAAANSLERTGRATLELQLVPGKNPTREVTENAGHLGSVTLQLSIAGVKLGSAVAPADEQDEPQTPQPPTDRRGDSSPPPVERESTAVATAVVPPTAQTPRAPRPPLGDRTTPQRPSTAGPRRPAQGKSPSTSPRRPSSVAGVPPVSLESANVAIDEGSLASLFADLCEDEGSEDGTLGVDTLLRFLRGSYETMGDPRRFERLLPDRCLEHLTGRPRSASSSSRKARLGGLKPDRVGKDEFALVLLRVARS